MRMKCTKYINWLKKIIQQLEKEVKEIENDVIKSPPEKVFLVTSGLIKMKDLKKIRYEIKGDEKQTQELMEIMAQIFMKRYEDKLFF